MRRVIPILKAALLAGFCAFAVVDCATNPATGERQLILISERQEIEMGRQGAQQVVAAIGLYQDPELQAYVEDVGKRLAAASERPDLPWSFQVVDDPVVNAFALPGGFIFMTRGIMTHFNSEAEMAAVLGHEIGHVTARHSAEQISRAQVAQLGLGVGSILVPEVGQYQDILGAGLGLLFLKFGRDDERQADDLGYRYMTREDYDPDEMVDVFAMLGRVSEAAGGSSLPGWLSTHPNPEEREQRILERIQRGPKPDGSIGRERYLQHIEGVVFGRNPRNGFFRDGLFLHPDLKFRLEFPQGWQTQNMAQAVAGISPDEDAIIRLTLSQESTPDAAARAFFSQQGINAGATSRQDINGLPASWGEFTVRTQQATLRGLAVFLAYDGNVYELLGYTEISRYGRYESTFRRSLLSFNRLTDRAVLDVQPKRVQLVVLDREMTLAQFASAYPSNIDVATLGIINGLREGETIPAGRTLKRVVGGELPE